VLMIEVQDTPRLSCKWLADLTQISREDSVVCDEAYDKAKNLMATARKMSSTEKGEAKRVTTKAQGISSQQLEIVLDASKVGFSAILKFKSICETYPGKDNIKLVFKTAGKRDKVLQLTQQAVQSKGDFESTVKALFNPLEWKIQ
jgi:hypothetical protein